MARRKSKAPSVASRPPAMRPLASGSSSAHSKLIDELLNVCVVSAGKFGVRLTPQRLRKAFGGVPSASFAREMLKDSQCVNEMFTYWQKDESYRDSQLQPSLLPLKGPAPSFVALCTQFGQRRRQRRLLALALQLKMCRQMRDGRLVFRRSTSLYMGNSILNLAFGVLCVERMLKTVLHNSRRGRTLNNAMVHREASGLLNKQQYVEFRGLARRSLAELLRSHANWIEARSPQKSARGTQRAGAVAFIFRD